MPFSVEKATVLRYNKITNKKCEIFTKGYPFVFVTDNRNKSQLTEKSNAEKSEAYMFRKGRNKYFPPNQFTLPKSE